MAGIEESAPSRGHSAEQCIFEAITQSPGKNIEKMAQRHLLPLASIGFSEELRGGRLYEMTSAYYDLL